ncbi:MAG TPA: DUF917 domain-containing protein [Anaerolineae bacterium]|nr:DUF917 domain-containing protein [Anaerolineae bacterium]
MGNVVIRTRQECEDFVRGLCFLATGGGGSPEVGLKALLDQLEAGRNIEWVDADSLPQEAWTAVVAGMGGRPAGGGAEEELAKLGCTEEKHDYLGMLVTAVRALQDSAGVKVQAIVPVEIGADNVPVPMVAAMELGLPVVDGDYAGGRAIPEVPQTIPEIRSVPVCPMSFVTRWGDVLILKDTVSTAMADRIGRMVNLASYGEIGCSCYLMQIREVKEVLASGTLSEALRVGQVIREAREKGADPVAQTVKAVDGWLLFEGEITEVEIADEQSYAFGLGSYQLRGSGSSKGRSFKIWYKNEYHVSWMDGRPFVTSPDSMIMVDLESAEPALSFDFSVGDRVAVIGRKGHPIHRKPEGIEVLGPRHFGFDLDYVPIENRAQEFGL